MRRDERDERDERGETGERDGSQGHTLLISGLQLLHLPSPFIIHFALLGQLFDDT